MDTNVGNEALAMGIFKWGDVEIDLDLIPRDTFVSLAKQGIVHKLGNEVASNIIKVKEKADKDFPDEPHDEDSGWLDETRIELRRQMIQKILDGTVGLRISGPRGGTLENIAYELAYKQAEETLVKRGYWPKLSKEDRKLGKKVEEVTINFNGRDMNRQMLAEVVLKQYEAKFMEEAKRVHAERIEKAKAAKLNAVAPVTQVQESAEDLLANLMAS